MKTAFLNGDLDKDIYMEISEGINMSDEMRKIKLLKLTRSIYRLGITSKNLNKKFTAEIKKLGLENVINEPCSFTWRFKYLLIMLIIYKSASNDQKSLSNRIQTQSFNINGNTFKDFS